MGGFILQGTRWATQLLPSVAIMLTGACVQTIPPAPAAEDPLAARPGSGTATVKGFVMSAEGETPLPLGGVRLSLRDAVTYSNVDGSFALEGVRAGNQPFFVDGTTAKSGDGAYGQFATTLTLVEEEKLTLERPIYLPFVPLTALRAVSPDRTTTVMSAEGIELEIPAGGARLEGKPFEGGIAIVTVAADRTPMPLPKRFERVLGSVISIQPIGVVFPVPVRLTVPLGETDVPFGYGTVWSLDAASGGFTGDTVVRRRGDSFLGIAGGLRSGGYHAVTEWQVETREPCRDAEDESSARACFDAASRALESAVALPMPSLPGARTLFGRLDAAMVAATAKGAPVEEIASVVAELYPVALESVRSYQALYRAVGDLEPMTLRATQVRVACGSTAACDPKNGDAALKQAQAALDGAIAAVRDNASRYAARFDRLSAAVAALEPYLSGGVSLAGDAAAGGRAAAVEYDAAYRGFEGVASPIDAYDALVDSLHALERAARAIHEAVGGRPRDGDGTIVQRVCVDRGATSMAATDEGFASVRIGEESGRLSEDCALVAINPRRGLVGAATRETNLLDGSRPPYLLNLTGSITERSLPEVDPRSGVLTAESPVHRWSVKLESRRALRASFFADGAAMAGLAHGYAVQVAREGGFDAFNLSDVESFSFLVFGLDARETVYVLSSETLDSLNDFGGSVAGSFDVNTRAAVMLFNGQAGDRVVVERACCDPGGSQFTYSLREPDGSSAPRVDFERETPGTGDEAFELSSDGLHRVVVAPLAGQFADYEIVLHRASSGAAKPIDLGVDVAASFDGIGATAVYTFVGGAGQIATIEGVSSEFGGQIVYTLVGPDGAAVGKSKVLYFDGSTFSSRAESLPLEGTYRLIFSSRLNETPVGAFTFRVTTRNP